MIEPLPLPILRAVQAEQDSFDWPRLVPKYAQLFGTCGKEVWKSYNELTVADCEQVVEHHTRKARKCIDRWKRRPLQKHATEAAKHIVRAIIYRCRYIELTGRDRGDDGEVPFDDEIKAALNR